MTPQRLFKEVSHVIYEGTASKFNDIGRRVAQTSGGSLLDKEHKRLCLQSNSRDKETDFKRATRNSDQEIERVPFQVIEFDVW
jgi:hypothetical protein